MKKTIKVLSVIFAVVLLFSLSCVAAFAEEPTATTSIKIIGSEFDSLEEAFAAARDGDTIKLSEGTFTTTQAIEMTNKAITLEGAGEGKTIIQSASGVAENSGINIRNTNGAHLIVKGITFEMLTDGARGICFSGASNGTNQITVENCAFEALEGSNNTIGLYLGGVFEDSDFINCTFTDNYCGFGIGGDAVQGFVGEMTVSGCEFTDCDYDISWDGGLTTSESKEEGQGSIVLTNTAAKVFDSNWNNTTEIEKSETPVTYETSALVVAEIVNGEKYMTLAEAVAAAKSGDTVKLLCDATGESIEVIGKVIKIDFNKFTYTVNAKAAGAATDSAFRIGTPNLADTVVFSNGTVKVMNPLNAGFTNSYGTLKLDNVVLDMSEITGKMAFGICINCAQETILTNGTEIIMSSKLDEGYSYNCAIRVYGTDNSDHTITLEECTLNGEILFQKNGTPVRTITISVTKDTVLAEGIEFRYANTAVPCHVEYVIPDAAAAAVMGDILLRPGDSIVYANNAPIVNTATIDLYFKLIGNRYAIGELFVGSHDAERVYNNVTEWTIKPIATGRVSSIESNLPLHFSVADTQWILRSDVAGVYEKGVTNAATPVGTIKGYEFVPVVNAIVDNKLVEIPVELFVVDANWGDVKITEAALAEIDPSVYNVEKVYDAAASNKVPVKTDDVFKDITVDGTEIAAENIKIISETTSFTNAGEYTVEFQIIDVANHADSPVYSYTVKISPKKVEDLTITGIPDVPGDGEEIPSFLYNGKVLGYPDVKIADLTPYVDDKTPYDYIVTDATATDVGTYTLTITFTDNFEGTITREWKIYKNDDVDNNAFTGTVPTSGNWAYGQSTFEVKATYGEVKYQLCDSKGVVIADQAPLSLEELRALEVGTYYVYAIVDETASYNELKSKKIQIRVTQAYLPYSNNDTFKQLLKSYLESIMPAATEFTFNGLDQSAEIIAKWNPTLEGFKEFVAAYVEEQKATTPGFADIIVPDVDIFEGFVQSTAGVTDYKENFRIVYESKNYKKFTTTPVTFNMQKVEITITPAGGAVIYNGEDQFIKDYTIVNEAELAASAVEYFKANFKPTKRNTVHYVGDKKVNNFRASLTNFDIIVTTDDENVMTVLPAPLTIEIDTNAALNNVYDGTEKVASVVVKPVEGVTDSLYFASSATTPLKATNAGKYDIEAQHISFSAFEGTKDVSNCYYIAQIIGGEGAFEIEPATIKVTYKGGSFAYGTELTQTMPVVVIDGVDIELEIDEFIHEYDFTNNGKNPVGTYKLVDITYKNLDSNHKVEVEATDIVITKATFTAAVDGVVAPTAPRENSILNVPYAGGPQVVTPKWIFNGILEGEVPTIVYYVYDGPAVDDDIDNRAVVYEPFDMTAANFNEVGESYQIVAVLSLDNYKDVVVYFDIDVVDNKAPADYKVTFNPAIYTGAAISCKDYLASIVIFGEVYEGKIQLTSTRTNADTYSVKLIIKDENSPYYGAALFGDWTINPHVITKVDFSNVADEYAWTVDAPANFYGTAEGLLPDETVNIALNWGGKVGEFYAYAETVIGNPNYTVACAEAPSYKIVSTNDTIKFKYASVTIGADYTVNFKVMKDVIDQYKNFKVTLTFGGNSVEFTSATVYDRDTDCYVFSYANINPKDMGDKVNATLEIAGTVATAEYSIQDYCYAQLAAKNASDPWASVLVAMLRYGEKLQKYVGETGGFVTETLVTDSAYADKNALSAAKPGYTALDTAATKDTDKVMKHSIGLVIDNGVRIKYYLTFTDAVDASAVTVKVNGATEVLLKAADGRYYVDIRVPFVRVSDAFTFVVEDAEGVIASATYSVETYAVKAVGTPEEGMAKAAVDFGYCLSKVRY